MGPHLLELETSHLPVEERLERAAERVLQGSCHAISLLRPEQVPVVEQFEALLLERTTERGSSAASSYWRIVLPPRTGKTVVAAHIVARTGLTALFVVPTRTLATQVVSELRAHLPHVPVGVMTGEEQAVVAHGVNVATYQLLQTRIRLGAGLPPPVRASALIFADEAHHAITSSRLQLLSGAFHDGALRVALTATPDYGAERRLRHHFPTEVAEMGVPEALRRNLLAPARAWVAEVDVDASAVRLVGGDYDPEALGTLMSAAPFFKATEVFRYGGANASMPALLCCSTRRQATELVAYLRRHRPAGRPAPALVLGDTPKAERERTLERFEAGDVDTLVQVGVLIEGWSSPRCKLLVDLAPSRSRVRSTQKYFRVMTPHEGREARMYVLLPRDLEELPVLPPDLLGAPLEGYEPGALLGPPRPGGSRPPVAEAPCPIADVRLRKRVLLTCPLEPPTLRRGDRRGLLAVLGSCADFDPAWGLRRFRRALFQHHAFSGSGAFLLGHLGVRSYDAWMGGLFPRQVADRILAEARVREGREPRARQGWRACGEADTVANAQRRQPTCDDEVALVLMGREPPPTPEELLERADDARLLYERLRELKPRRLKVLSMRFGLLGREPHTHGEIASHLDVSRGRVGSIEAFTIAEVGRIWRRATQRDRALRRDWQLRVRSDPSTTPPVSPPQGVVAPAVRRAVSWLDAACRHTGRPPSLGEIDHELGGLWPAAVPHVERWARERYAQVRPRSLHDARLTHRILYTVAALMAARRGHPSELLFILQDQAIGAGSLRVRRRWARRFGLPEPLSKGGGPS